MAIGFKPLIIIVDMLIAVECAHSMLLRDRPLRTNLITHLLQRHLIEEFHTGIGHHRRLALVIFHLQSATQDVLSLAAIGVRFPVVGILQIAPTLIDGIFRTIGILLTLTKREFEVANQFLAKCQRHVKTVAR